VASNAIMCVYKLRQWLWLSYNAMYPKLMARKCSKYVANGYKYNIQCNVCNAMRNIVNGSWLAVYSVASTCNGLSMWHTNTMAVNGYSVTYSDLTVSINGYKLQLFIVISFSMAKWLSVWNTWTSVCRNPICRLFINADTYSAAGWYCSVMQCVSR